MITLIKLSFRNVFRQRRRSLVTMVAGGVGVLGLLFYLSIMNGMIHEMVVSALGFRLPAVSVEKIDRGDFSAFVLDRSLEEKIGRLEGVEGISPRLIRDSLMVSADLSVISGARGVRLYGVDPEKERSVTKAADLLEKQKGGEWFSGGYNPDDPTIVIGDSLAEKLKVQVGDFVILTVLQTIEEEDRMSDEDRSADTRAALRVGGIFRSNDTSFEKNNAYVHIRFLEPFQPGEASRLYHQLAVRTDPSQAEAVRDRIAVLFPENARNEGLLVRSWKEKDPFLSSNVKVFEVFNQILLFIVLAASSFVVVNTMLMVVQERFREFGILKAVGAGGGSIAAMILLEGVILALFGVIGGMAVSLPLIGGLWVTGINLGVFSGALGEMGVPSLLHPFVLPGDLILTFALAVVFAWLGTIFPAIRAARIRPLDAIHFR